MIAVTPGILPSARSSGVATVAAILSGLAPGRLAWICTAGKSTCGRGATGSMRQANNPSKTMPTAKSDEATGRFIKGSAINIGIYVGWKSAAPSDMCSSPHQCRKAPSAFPTYVGASSENSRAAGLPTQRSKNKYTTGVVNRVNTWLTSNPPTITNPKG